MKRMWIVGYAILILNLLIGCGTPKEEVKEVVQESEVGVEEVQKEKVALSEQELQELFQLIYEQSGGRNANTEEQKVLELEALGKITPPEEKIFPEDVNERYTRWRGDVEKAQREELEQKYWEMVSGLTVYEYSNMSDGGYSQNEYSVEENSGGLLYADAVDMDGNGVVELLTISVKKESYGDGLLKVGVYGMQGNIVAELETMEIPWSFGMGAAWGINGIDICQRDEKVYIGHWFDYSGGGGMRTGFEYYGLEKEGWSAEKLLYELNWENPNDPEHTYLRNEEAITAGEYEEILNSYQSISLFTTDYGSVSINEEARGAYVSRLKELEESLKNRQIRILVDGKEIAASAKLEDKTVLIPICETFDAMGIQVIDNAEEGMFIATTRKNSLKFHNMWAYSILDFCDVYMDEELQDDLPEGLLVEKDGVLFLPLTMLERFWERLYLLTKKQQP